VELVRAFQRAYERLHLEGAVIGVDLDPLAPALNLVDKMYVVPGVLSPVYISTLMRIIQRERVNLVFPLIDPDIPVLAANMSILESGGAKLCVVPIQSVKIVNDKWETAKFFRKLRLETPRTWLPSEIDPLKPGFPAFIKPRGGSAAKNAFKVHNRKELEFFLEYVPNPILQEFVSGPEITTDVACTCEGEILSIVSRKRIEVRWGEVSKGVTVCDKRIIEACIQIARSLPAHGPITVQCIMNNDLPVFTEINARLGGGVPLGIAAGADSPMFLLARAAGIEVDLPRIGDYKTGLYMTRYDDSYFLEESDVADIRSRGI